VSARKLAPVAASGLTGGMAVLYFFPPAQYSFYPRCPIYSATHLLCPGCGGTRALYELLHFNVSGALHYNALLTMLAPLALLWLAFCWYQAVRRHTALEIRLPAGVTVALVLVTVLFTVARNSGMAFSIQ
jgi:Protein of unknown function (DUF2752)